MDRQIGFQSKLQIEDMMTTCVVTVSPDMTMREAKEIMRLKNVSGTPVVDNERRLLGIVSIADVVQALDDQVLDKLVKERMTVNVCTVKPHDTVNTALSLFRKHQYRRLPVVNDQNVIVGMITPNDIVKRLANYLQLDIVEEPPLSCSLGHSHTMEFSIKGGDFEQAGVVASTLKKKLVELGINPSIIRKAAIATYEAEMNVVIHAYEGILKAYISPEKLIINVTDTGPGIKDIDQAMQIGFSTAPDQIRELGFGAGMGLPNIKKSSDVFDISSRPGEGTELRIQIFF
ncbi:MAG: CBS domain-containing protein [Peptococcales bacterium]